MVRTHIMSVSRAELKANYHNCVQLRIRRIVSMRNNVRLSLCTHCRPIAATGSEYVAGVQ